MEFTVNINNSLVSTGERLAAGQIKSPEEYFSHVLNKFLLREFKNEAIDKINNSGIDEVSRYIEPVKAVDIEIKAEKQAIEDAKIIEAMDVI